jgi:hypothetical protein
MTKTCPDCHAEVLSTSQPNRMGTTTDIADEIAHQIPDNNDMITMQMHVSKRAAVLAALAATPAVGGEREALLDLLAYERQAANLKGFSDCTCMGHSRDAESAYEMGECPHQKARAVLIAQPASPLRGRDLDIPIEIDCYEPLTLREIIVAYFMADNRPFDGLGKRYADRYLAALASPPEQPAADPVTGESCAHAAIISLDGKWHCQRCGDAIEMAVAQSSSAPETQP